MVRQPGRPELCFVLEQPQYATDGTPWTPLYLPCFSPGAAGERLGEALQDGMEVLITSGRLSYKKRATKNGEQSRLEILVWAADVLSESPQVDSADRRAVR